MKQQQKNDALEKIMKQQSQLLRHTIKIAKLPPAKKWLTAYNRAAKVVGLAMHYRRLEVEKRLLFARQSGK